VALRIFDATPSPLPGEKAFVKRSLPYLCASLLTLASVLAALPSPAAAPNLPAKASAKDPCAGKPSKWARMQCEQYNHSAPGDEYFGKMKMSYLGINNTFRDEAVRAGDYTTDPGIISKVGFADEALEQWSHRYPNDPQLARSYFLAISMYKKIYTRPAQDKAWSYMHILTGRFGATYFGKIERTALLKGFTEHYFANAELCPTPLPSGAPLPETTPNATATPAPAPGQPKVDIIVPPCVQPSPIVEPSPIVQPSPILQPSPVSSPT
jgi:hypothetical protein